MKLYIKPIVNFQKESGISHEIIKRHLHPYSLISQNTLFQDLLKDVSSNINFDEYRKQFQANQLSVSLYFDDYKFREQYLDWIYHHYSNSKLNHQRVHHSEIITFIKGIKKFNKNSKHLKFIQIIPDVDDSHLWARLNILGIALTDHLLSFKIKNAMEDEYRLDKNQALYQFEKKVGQCIADAFQNYFKRCIPSFPFEFSEAYLNKNNISFLKPLKPVKEPKLSNKKNNYKNGTKRSSEKSKSVRVFASSASIKSSKSSSVSSKLSNNYSVLDSSNSRYSSSLSSESSNSFSVKSSDVSSSSNMDSSLSTIVNSNSVSLSNSSISSSSSALKKSSPISSSMEWLSANDSIDFIKVASQFSVEDVNSKSKPASSGLISNSSEESISSGLSDRNSTANVSLSSQSIVHSHIQRSLVSDSRKISQSESSDHVQANKGSLTNTSYSSASIYSLSSDVAISNTSDSKLNSSMNSSSVNKLIANSEINSNYSKYYILWIILIVIFIIIIATIVIDLNIN